MLQVVHSGNFEALSRGLLRLWKTRNISNFLHLNYPTYGIRSRLCIVWMSPTILVFQICQFLAIFDIILDCKVLFVIELLRHNLNCSFWTVFQFTQLDVSFPKIFCASMSPYKIILYQETDASRRWKKFIKFFAIVLTESALVDILALDLSWQGMLLKGKYNISFPNAITITKLT